MLSQERLDAYRRMTPSQKWAEFSDLVDSEWQRLLTLPLEERERILESHRREHQESNDAIVEALSRPGA